jgi:hypothetical protein
MTTTAPATLDRLSREFNRCFETLAAPADVFAADVFCDLLPPHWRFQLQGRDAFATQLQAIAEGPVTARVLRVEPTAHGFVLEHEETQRVPRRGDVVARRLWLCAVRDGLITDVTGYCNGGWDDDLRARHAAEAPMLRP